MRMGGNHADDCASYAARLCVIGELVWIHLCSYTHTHAHAHTHVHKHIQKIRVYTHIIIYICVYILVELTQRI